VTNQLGTEFADADNSTGLLLWQVTNRWQPAVRAALKPFGLTHVQFVLLASLTWLATEQPVSQRELADHAVTDPMMTSQVLRVLAERGYLIRAPHPTDGRAKLLRVTDAGRTLANQAVVAVEACDAEFFGGLGARLPAFGADLLKLRS
jgi:DNA-binding MarR family transcriptional regulator